MQFVKVDDSRKYSITGVFPSKFCLLCYKAVRLVGNQSDIELEAPRV
jgi:hypothetical protein